MKINWALSSGISPGLFTVEELKEIAPIYGSYSTWNYYRTDNCVCCNTAKSQELIKRGLHYMCNLFLPEEIFNAVGQPSRVNLFSDDFSALGDFKDELVPVWLASRDADIVLLLGYNFKPHLSREKYYFAVLNLIEAHPSTQYVLIDNDGELSPILKDLSNLSQDCIASVRELL